MTQDQTGVISYAGLTPPKGKDPKEWERKQRLKEYRIASRREKRNRKSDEKKQRALNAQILRRMTRNPAKYNKNAGRNRLRAIELERRKIHHNAVRMAQRMAAVHDPSGQTFNVEPVTTLDDGCVITVHAFERRQENAKRKAEQAANEDAEKVEAPKPVFSEENLARVAETGVLYVEPAKLKELVESKKQKPRQAGLSKTQQKKQALYAPRPPPPKPVIPDEIEPPSDEEENWLALWDLPDEEVERRVTRAKRRAQQERKNLRLKQKEGKTERRAARDEKRRVYRDLKQSWKVIREEERRRRKFLNALEDEEGKKLAIAINKKHRREALECAAKLGFTLENVEGLDEIKPKALGMRGVEVDWEKLEIIGEAASGLRLANGEEHLKRYQNPAAAKGKKSNRRVNLGAIAAESRTRTVTGADNSRGFQGDFVQFGADAAQGREYEEANLNHKTRRKLRRALEAVELRKEMAVREKAIEYCNQNNIPVPVELTTPERPINARGSRILSNGTLETGKQERVRARVELAEFNKWAKVLRKQAKEMSTEAGMRVYLELMGRIPSRVTEGERTEEERERYAREDEGRPMTAAEFLANWPIPGEEGDGVGNDMGRYGERVGEQSEDEDEDVGGGYVQIGGTAEDDSPSRQLKMDMRRSASKDRDDDEDEEGPKIGDEETDSDDEESEGEADSASEDESGSTPPTEGEDEDEDEDIDMDKVG